MKGKFVRTLKAVKAIGYLKPDRILQISGADGFVDKLLLPKLNFNILQQNPNSNRQCNVVAGQDDLVIDDVDDETTFDDELTRDVVDDNNNNNGEDDKENMAPQNKAENLVNLKLKLRLLKVKDSEPDAMCLTEFDKYMYRPPDMGASSLFDPNLLAAFEEAVMQIKAQEKADMRARRVEEERRIESCKIEEEMRDPLLDFKYKCPPSGGEDSVVLYTTGLRGIRKTFEDCSSIRFLLQSFRVLFFERDVSMHCEFKEELWRLLGEKVVPPKLFIKGRYIGGAEVVLGLHEQGKLRCLFDGIPFDHLGGPCEGCGGFRFVVCFRCNGSRKIVDDDENQVVVQCPECNENGLLICPLCC